MVASFGHRWTSAHGDDFPNTSGRLWAIELAGLSERHIVRGLEVARRADSWPPVLPDFAFYCRGGIPLAEVDVNLQQPAKEWRPFTVLVKRQINDAQWRMSTPDQQWQQLTRAWERAKAHLMAGGALPAYTPAAQQLTASDHVEPPPPFVMSTEECLDEIRRTLHIHERTSDSGVSAAKIAREREPCIRCKGTRQDPEHRYHRLQTSPGECIACYGSGIEAGFNRVVREDGTIEERLQ